MSGAQRSVAPGIVLGIQAGLVANTLPAEVQAERSAERESVTPGPVLKRKYPVGVLITVGSWVPVSPLGLRICAVNGSAVAQAMDTSVKTRRKAPRRQPLFNRKTFIRTTL